MVKVECKTKVIDNKEYVSIYLVFKHHYKDVKFLVVPFPKMSNKQKYYLYDLARKRIKE